MRANQRFWEPKTFKWKEFDLHLNEFTKKIILTQRGLDSEVKVDLTYKSYQPNSNKSNQPKI